MFDNATDPVPAPSQGGAERRRPSEDERIALRCNRKELQLVDSFVASGEFASRSELMREALRAFLRDRALSATPDARGAVTEIVTVPVRLRRDEAELLSEYARWVANGQAVGDLLAAFVREAERRHEVAEMVARARARVREAVENRDRLAALAGGTRDLERSGVVGR